MPKELTPGQKAALTRKRRAAAQKATSTKKRMDAVTKARAAEAASKEALRAYCDENGFQLAFFEGKTGAPRTGIIDAVVFRIARGQADVLDLRLVQLKGGSAGVSGAEITRLKKACTTVTVNWLGSGIEDMNRRAFKQHAADRALPPGFPGRAFHDVLEVGRIAVGRLGAEKTVAFRASHISHIGLAQSCSRPEKGVKHSLQVKRGARHRLPPAEQQAP